MITKNTRLSLRKVAKVILLFCFLNSGFIHATSIYGAASIQELLSEDFSQLSYEKLAKIYADKDLSNADLLKFAKSSASYEDLKTVHTIDLHSQKEIKQDGILAMLSSPVFKSLINIDLSYVPMKPEHVWEVVKVCKKSKTLGSCRDLMQISAKFEEVSCEVYIKLDKLTYKAFEEFKNKEKLKDSDFINNNFAIKYTYGLHKEATGMKWIHVLEG